MVTLYDNHLLATVQGPAAPLVAAPDVPGRVRRSHDRCDANAHLPRALPEQPDTNPSRRRFRAAGTKRDPLLSG